MTARKGKRKPIIRSASNQTHLEFQCGDSVSVSHARPHWSALVRRAEKGEHFFITKRGGSLQDLVHWMRKLTVNVERKARLVHNSTHAFPGRKTFLAGSIVLILFGAVHLLAMRPAAQAGRLRTLTACNILFMSLLFGITILFQFPPPMLFAGVALILFAVSCWKQGREQQRKGNTE